MNTNLAFNVEVEAAILSFSNVILIY